MHSIKNYAVYTAKAKLEKPISDATHTLTEISFIVLRITLQNGTVGESYLLSFQYNPEAIVGALKDVGEIVLGEQVFNTVKVFEKLNNANEYFGMEGLNRWAQGAFNIAMWDAWAKVLGNPIWKILGASKTEIPIYGSGGWISYSAEELLDEVIQYKKRGFRAVKIKVGKPDWREDLERLRLVRENLGNDMNIMMDANQGMNVANALQLAREARNLQINWFEEPIINTNYQGYELLRNQAGISIAMGEREYSLEPLRELLQRNAIDLWQPDILRLGGVEMWRNSAALAGSYHVNVLPHYYKDYDVPLLCTIPNGVGAESFDWIDNLIDRPLQIKNGMTTPHDLPGWGFNFKDGFLNEV